MFRIGDFAKIARVSVKTLHHYDEVGLLKPEWVDATTSYRYYTIDQLPRLNRILALKDLGFTLHQIRSILNENLSPAEIRAMLRLKEAELANLIQEEQERLERVKVRLQQIEREDLSRDYDILVKSIEPVVIASARKIIPMTTNLHQQCAELAFEVYNRISRVGGAISGHWCSIYHETAYESQNERIDVEMAAEVEASLLEKAALFPSERVTLRELPETSTMACLLHQGSYDGLWDAHIALMTWIEANGCYSVGPYRCVYLRVPQQGDEPLTELQIPIERSK
jgi:DNA-binding transcriptional MerR regulator